MACLGGTAAVAARLVPAGAHAEAPKMLRVGGVGPRGGTMPPWSDFTRRLAELGYVEGRNLVFDYVRFRNAAEIPRAYRQLVDRNADIVVAAGLEIALRTAIEVAGSRPIVMIALDYDPLSLGLVADLARPRRNVTGVFSRQVELTAKRVELLKEALPQLTAATLFFDRFSARHRPVAEAAAARLGMRLHGVEFRAQPYDYERAFADVPAEFRGGLLILGSPFFVSPDYRRLPAFALRHRLPGIFIQRKLVEGGGLISYGPDYGAMWRRAADYVDRIARGAKPADLPIEQSAKFELVANLNTARALGVRIPASILLRATGVIE